MLLSESEISDFETYEDIYIPEVAAELRRWRNAVKRRISQSENMPEGEITDIVLERYLEEMEK